MARPSRPVLGTTSSPPPPSRPRPSSPVRSAGTDVAERSVAWRDVPSVVRLTTAILRAHEAASSRSVDEVIAIGRQVLKVKELLAHGEFLAWSRHAVPFGERTVQRWLALVDFADREPHEFRRFAHLGLAKLYRVAALAPEPRGALKVRTPIPVPDTDETKTIEVMTTLELDRVIGRVATPPVPRTSIAKLVQGYRFRLAGLRVLNDELRARARDVDRTLASELVAELYGLAEALESTFMA